MIKSIVQYDKKTLMKISVDHLTKAVDRFVRDSFNNVEGSGEKLKAALQELKAFEDSGVNDPAKDERLKKAVKEARKNVKEAIDNVNGYIDEQKALMKARGVSENMVYTWAIVPVGETTPAGVEVCRMVKRGFAFELPTIEDEEDARSINRAIRSPSEGVMSNEERRGRYNDGGLLIEQSRCGIDRSEALGD